MMTRRTFLSISLGLLASGCLYSLPPTAVRHEHLSSPCSYDKVCPPDLHRAEITTLGPSPITGLLECNPARATIVLFNSMQIRVRTITISQEGELHDEISPLSPNKTPAERLLSDIERALGARPHETPPPETTLTVRVLP